MSNLTSWITLKSHQNALKICYNYHLKIIGKDVRDMLQFKVFGDFNIFENLSLDILKTINDLYFEILDDCNSKTKCRFKFGTWNLVQILTTLRSRRLWSRIFKTTLWFKLFGVSHCLRLAKVKLIGHPQIFLILYYVGRLRHQRLWWNLD